MIALVQYGKNSLKSGPKMRLERFKIQKFPRPYPPQPRPFGPRRVSAPSQASALRASANFSPPLQKASCAYAFDKRLAMTRRWVSVSRGACPIRRLNLDYEKFRINSEWSKTRGRKGKQGRIFWCSPPFLRGGGNQKQGREIKGEEKKGVLWYRVTLTDNIYFTSCYEIY